MTPKIERRLADIQRRLMAARESLGILEEQVQVWNDALEDARIRSLVSETPLQQQEYDELSTRLGRQRRNATALSRSANIDG